MWFKKKKEIKKPIENLNKYFYLFKTGQYGRFYVWNVSSKYFAHDMFEVYVLPLNIAKNPSKVHEGSIYKESVKIYGYYYNYGEMFKHKSGQWYYEGPWQQDFLNLAKKMYKDEEIQIQIKAQKIRKTEQVRKKRDLKILESYDLE